VRRTLTAGSILTVNQQQGLDFSPDGKWLATLDDKVIKWEERGVTIWDIESGKTVATLPCPTKPRQSSRAVAFSPDGKLLAVGHSQGRVDLWNTATWQHAGGWALPGRTDDFAAIRFTADGKRLVVLTSKKPSWSYFQGEAGLWDVAGRTELANLKGHRGPVTGVAVSPDGKTLATTSVDRTIKLWDGKSGQYLATLVDRQEVAVAVAFSHDGTQLAALGMDGIIRIWHAPRTAEH
jgi:WD40 repeat protein